MNKPIEIVERFIPTWEEINIDKNHLFYLYTCEEKGISSALWPSGNSTSLISARP